jgi:hypothetical protein
MPEDTAVLYCRVQGRPCERVLREQPVNDPGESETPIQVYVASEKGVYETCGGLGCVAGPDPQKPHIGVCGIPTEPNDCAGPGIDEAKMRCNRQHLVLSPPKEILPERFLLTGAAMLDGGYSEVRHYFAAGGLYQVGLWRSRSRPLHDGGYIHESLPLLYLHLAGLANSEQASHELGIVVKTGYSSVSRIGLIWQGQVSGPDGLLESGRTWRSGPAVQAEIYYNLILGAAWLPGGSAAGPQWLIGVQYAASLWNDFKQK